MNATVSVSTAQTEVQHAVAELKARIHAEDIKIARFIEANPQQSIADARDFVARFLRSEKHARYQWILRRWDKLLSTKTSAEIASIFREGNDATEELRSSAPFCGTALESI